MEEVAVVVVAEFSKRSDGLWEKRRDIVVSGSGERGSPVPCYSFIYLILKIFFSRK